MTPHVPQRPGSAGAGALEFPRERAPHDVLRRPRPVPLGGLALLWLVLIDVPDGVEVGRFSAGAVLTVITALVCFGTLIAKASTRPLPDEAQEPLSAPEGPRRVPLALILFALWATASALMHASVAGAQNVLVYDTFVGALIACSSFTSAGSSELFLARTKRAAWLVAALYLVTVTRDGWGASTIYGPRSIALTGVLLVAVAVSCRNKLLAVVAVVTIGSSLSRTAAVVAIGVLCLGLALNGRRHVPRLFRIAAWAAAGLVSAGLAVTKIGPLHDRFLGGDQAVEYHGIRYNTSGRTELWSFTWRLAHDHLLFGGGPGDAQNHVTAQFGVRISHPHNDYLRLLNDVGVVGLALFLIGLMLLLRATWIRGRRTGAPLHWAAFLGLLGVALAAITDNALIYPFVMTPLGVVVGLSLAHPAPEALEGMPCEAPRPPRSRAALRHQERGQR